MFQILGIFLGGSRPTCRRHTGSSHPSACLHRTSPVVMFVIFVDDLFKFWWIHYWKSLKHWLRALAPGLTPRAELEKMAALQMVDVHLPTTDGRCPILSRHTQPEKDRQLLLAQLKLVLPPEPPPKITSTAIPTL